MGLIYKKLWVVGRRGRRRVETLFDTGSSHSLLNEEIAREIGTPEELPEPKTYEAAVGRVVAREGIFADILIQGKRLTTGLKIVPGLSEELILGADFLQLWHIRLEPRGRRIILDPRALRLKAVGLRVPRATARDRREGGSRGRPTS